VKSYREDFGSQIAQQGIDSVISRLEPRREPSEISKTTKAAGSNRNGQVVMLRTPALELQERSPGKSQLAPAHVCDGQARA